MHIHNGLKIIVWHIITIGITLFYFLQKDKCSDEYLHQVTVGDLSCMRLYLL